MRRGLGAAALCSALAACSSGGGSDGVVTISNPGTQSQILSSTAYQARITDPDLALASAGAASGVTVLNSAAVTGGSAVGGLVDYALGIDIAQQDVVALAAIRESSVGAPVTSGTAQYKAAYNYAAITGIGTEQITAPPLVASPTGQLVRTGTAQAGTVLLPNPFQTVDLTADFGAGTVQGNTADLSVNGTVSGATLGGQVTVRPQSGTSIDAALQGEIGANGVVGAFAGNTPNAVVAGGLVGQRQP